MSAAFARGSVPGATPMDRAVALAGVLAELGQTRLLWRAGGEAQWRALCARQTDLPGVLCDARGGELRVEGIGLVARVDAAAAVWEVSGDGLGAVEAITALRGLESGAGGPG